MLGFFHWPLAIAGDRMKTKCHAGLIAIITALLLGSVPSLTLGGMVFETFNGPPSPQTNPERLIWAPADIGWYWTPGSDVLLEGIQTQLDSGASNINNNFTFTTTLYTDRPDVGGSVLGSFTWNGITFVDGLWLGGSFASAISLTGGTRYFVGMSGWDLAFIPDGPDAGTQPDRGAGVNWIFPNGRDGADNFGAGSSYLSSAANPGSFDTQLSPSGLGTTDQGVVRFIAADEQMPSAVPEPASLTLFGLGALGLVLGISHRQKAARHSR